MQTLYDLHSHILPNLDDGSKNLEMTFCMLRESMEQSVDYIAATPHYYSDKPIKNFIQARNDAYFLVREMLDDYSAWQAQTQEKKVIFPQIVLGAEVALSPILPQMEELRDLCISGTNYLLLEMPFRQWNDKDLENVEQIIKCCGIFPIIAHIERFTRFTNAKSIDSLLSLPVSVQINAELIISNFFKAKQFMERDIQCFIGSDSHNMTTRPQNLRDAADVMERRQLSSILNAVCNNSKVLFEESKVI